MKAESPLRKIFFDCAIFLQLGLGGGGKEAPELFYEGVLALNPESDLGLFLALEKRQEKFCGCRARNKKQSRQENRKLVEILARCLQMSNYTLDL
jgi:hypothetical protein